jgi:uroporphyrinogen decarboxylase
MVEGKGSKTFSEARKMIVRNPVLSHKLLETITESTILYLKAQIAAGANLVQIFDSWAGILGPDLYREFGLKYIAQICDAINKVPKTVFAKGAFFARKNMKDINCEVVGLDWHTHARASRAIIGDEKTLQGNLDPAILYGSDEFVIEKTIEMMRTFEGKRHIANLGHGVYPDTDPEKVKLFIETVKAYKI